MSLLDEHLGGIADKGDPVFEEPGSRDCVRRVRQLAEVQACSARRLAQLVRPFADVTMQIGRSD